MGTTPVNTDNAAALTPTLFLGEYLSIDHENFSSVDKALDTINSGGTVLVNREVDAFLVLVRLGVSVGDASYKIKRATTVLPNTEPLNLRGL